MGTQPIKKLLVHHRLLQINGGAIALGHPLDGSGARILTTLVHEMGRRPDVALGPATMCIGVGQGIAMVIEKIV